MKHNTDNYIIYNCRGALLVKYLSPLSLHHKVASLPNGGNNILLQGGVLRQYSSVDVEVSHQQSSFNLYGGDKMVSNFHILRPPNEFPPSRLIVVMVNIPFLLLLARVGLVS